MTQPVDQLLAHNDILTHTGGCAAAVYSNFVVAKSQDILTDGLTVRLLADKERGFAINLQVVAYKPGDAAQWRDVSVLLRANRLADWDAPDCAHAWHWATCRVCINCGANTMRLHTASGLSAALTPTAALNSPKLPRSDLPVLCACVACLLVVVAHRTKLPDGLISTVVRPFAVDYGMSSPPLARLTNYAIVLGGISGISCRIFVALATRAFTVIAVGIGHRKVLSNIGYFSLSVLAHSVPLWWAVSLFEPVVVAMSTVILFATMMHFARRAYAGVDATFQATLFVAASSMRLVSG